MSNGQEELERLEKVHCFYEEEDVFDKLIIERENELIREHFTSNTDVLEVGCGNGYASVLFRDYFKSYDVVEPVEDNIKLLNKRLLDNNESVSINITKCLFEELNTEKRYDYILLLNILEHVENPTHFLIKSRELLKPKGRIAISVPNFMSLNRRAGNIMGVLEDMEKMAPKDYRVGHRRLYSTDLIIEQSRLAELEVEILSGIFLKPLSEQQMMELGMEVVRAFYKLGEDIPEYCSTIFAILREADYV